MSIFARMLIRVCRKSYILADLPSTFAEMPHIARKPRPRQLSSWDASLPFFFKMRHFVPHKGKHAKPLSFRQQYHLYSFQQPVNNFLLLTSPECPTRRIQLGPRHRYQIDQHSWRCWRMFVKVSYRRHQLLAFQEYHRTPLLAPALIS